jgi:hypothetical protein
MSLINCSCLNISKGVINGLVARSVKIVLSWIFYLAKTVPL